MLNRLPLISIGVYILAAIILVALKDKSKKVSKVILMLAVLSSIVSIFFMIKPIVLNGQICNFWFGNKVPVKFWAVGIGFEIDAFGVFFGILEVLLMFLASIAMLINIKEAKVAYKKYVLLLVQAAAALNFIFTGDMFNLYISLEIVVLSAIVLIDIDCENEKLLLNKFKRIIISFFGSCLILLGIALLYAQLHTLNLAQLSAFLHGEIFNPVIVFSLVLLIAGFFIKTFMLPLQSVYSEFENNASEWDLIGFELSIRILGIYVVIRLMFMIFPTLGLNQAGTFLVLLGMIIMIISSVISVFKSNFRHMLSYIMFSCNGFIFTMFGLAIYNTNYIKVLGTIAGVYSLLNLVLSFSILFLVLDYVGKADKASNKVLGTNPFYTVVFFIAAASICNLPPFGGFAAIMLLVKLLVHTKYLALLSVYMVTAILNLIAFYRSGKLLFSEKAKKKFNIKDIRHWFYTIAVALVALMVLICGIIPHLVINILIKPITASLYYINKYIDSVFIGGYANKMFKNKIDTPNFNAAFAGYWKEQYITTYIFATILIFIGVFYVFYRKKAMESKLTKDILNLIVKIKTSTFGKVIKTVYKKLIALSFYIKRIVDDVGKANINDLVIYQLAFLAMITLFLFSVL